VHLAEYAAIDLDRARLGAKPLEFPAEA